MPTRNLIRCTSTFHVVQQRRPTARPTTDSSVFNFRFSAWGFTKSNHYSLTDEADLLFRSLSSREEIFENLTIRTSNYRKYLMPLPPPPTTKVFIHICVSIHTIHIRAFFFHTHAVKHAHAHTAHIHKHHYYNVNFK